MKFIISSAVLYHAMVACSQYKFILKDNWLKIGNNGEPTMVSGVSKAEGEYTLDVHQGNKIVSILKLLDEQPLTIKYEGHFLEIQNILI